MQPRKIINPMPESLDDTQIGPNDRVYNTTPAGHFGEVPQEQVVSSGESEEKLTAKKIAEINSLVATKLTDDMINKEILDEKIRQDIASMKKDVKAPSSPRDVLKNLISRGDYREDVEIFGSVWTMKALSQGDIIMAFNDIKDDAVSAVGKVATLTVSQIAFSVEACNGVSIYEWFPDILNRQDFATTEDFKLAVRKAFRRYLEQMSTHTLNEFDAAYTAIEKKRNEALAELKKS